MPSGSIRVRKAGPLSPRIRGDGRLDRDPGSLETRLYLPHVEESVEALHPVRQPGVEREDVALEHPGEDADRRLAVLEDEISVFGVAARHFEAEGLVEGS